ncbi:hypothetical protein PENSPDRAFT_625698 [Peniophora sp. CONT]|nr:hypothetical protein PENSPDRAFT_625698 [Peniophora sp. CONT]
MSSNEADTPRGRSTSKPPAAKKQRIPRVGLACDKCRKRKQKCDGRLGGDKCAQCSQNGWACEFMHAMQKYQVGYVKALENKIVRLHRVLRRLHPNEDFFSEVGVPLTEDNWATEGFLDDDDSSADVHTPSIFVSAQSLPLPEHEPHAKAEETSDVEGDQALKLSDLTDEFKHLTLGTYLGPYSSAALVHKALNLTYELTGARLSLSDLSRFGRPMFWKFNSWEYAQEHTMLDFPPPDLLHTLIDLYFDRQNPYMPVLHRPTFGRHLSTQLHHMDMSFGFLVLQVCANGARYSDDPRVFLPGVGTRSAGWIWFNQVRGRSSLHNGTSRLFDLQSICLGTMYLMGCAAAQASWVWCGHGIRLAQDVGAHKKKTYGTSPSAVDEQFKRAFWVLVLLDRHLSASMSRPCATRDDELDLDLPTPCDDDYWEHADPSQALKQPEILPSRLDIFVCYLKLYQSVGPGMNLIFADPKGRATYGAEDGQWEQTTLADLDSRLTTWADKVPAHLRWDPGGQDDISLLQSAHLWARFHNMQITIHRPFIAPRPGTPKEVTAELGVPSLVICLSAARAIVRIVDCVQHRFPGRLFPLLHKPVYEAGMMLFLSIWGSKKFGVASRVEEDLRGIHSCERFLETLETRMHPAGRHRDMMNALLSFVELPAPDQSRGQKRTLDESQAYEEPAAATLASLDDWFAGTQYDSTQPSLQSMFGSTSGPVDGQGNTTVWASELGMTGLSDAFATSGYSLPLQGWGIDGSGVYEAARDELGRTFGGGS